MEKEAQDLVLYGQAYPRAKLDREELDYFETQFDKLMGMDGSVERILLQDRKDVILDAIKAIKYKLDNPRFTGWNPGDQELGWSAIFPCHVKYNNAIKLTWLQTLTGSGTWDRWLDAGATTPYVAPYAAGQVVLGISSIPYLTSVQPLLSAVRWEIDRQVLVPFDLRPIALGDNVHQVPIYPHPTILILPRSTVRARIVSEVAGNDYIRPVGLTIGLGKFLKQEQATATDWTSF
jgi:hypothetical protein